MSSTFSARERANVPRQGQRQTLTGLDSYHQFMVQESRIKEPLPPGSEGGAIRAGGGGGRAERPYTTGHTKSFSIPRPNHTPSSSGDSLGDTRQMGYSDPASLPWPQPAVYGVKPPTVVNNNESATNTYHNQIPPIRTQPSLAQLSSPSLVSVSAEGFGSDRLQHNSANLSWRPVYLKKRVLLAFAALFACLAVAAEALLSLSKRNTGVDSPNGGGGLRYYLWQYAAPSIAVLVAALWARAEYQAQMAAPWVRLSRGPATAAKTLLLDYASKIQPLVIYESLRNRDWVVGIVSVAGLLLRLVVVVAVALVIPVFVDVEDNMAGMTLEGSFVDDDNAGLQTRGGMAFAAMVALQASNVTYLDGVADNFAFQPFRADLPSAAELQLTVDGFQGRVECEDAQLTLAAIQLLQGSTTQLSLRASAGSCTTTQTVENELLSATTSGDTPRVFMWLGRGGCGNSTAGDQQRIVVMTGTLTVDPDSIPDDAAEARNVALSGDLPQSAALLCRPNYDIGPVEVVKNGTAVFSIRREENADATQLDQVHPWDMARAHFAAVERPGPIPGIPAAASYYEGEAVVHSDVAMDLMLATVVRQRGVPQLASVVQQPDTLRSMTADYWSQYSALLARTSLMDETRQEVTGRAWLLGDRLVVQEVATHLMASFLGLACIAALAAAVLVPKKGFLPREPATVLDVATMIAHSRSLLQCLRGTGASDEVALRERLEGADYSLGVDAYEKMSASGQGYFRIIGGHPHTQDQYGMFTNCATWERPIWLRLWARLIVVACIVSIIAGLEAVLRVSDLLQWGIAPVSGRNNMHFLWTTGPAILFLSLHLFLSSADFATRSQAPFAKLRSGGPIKQTIGLDFLNKCGPVALWSSIRTANFSVLVTIITAFLASLLIVFSSALFTAVPVPSSRGATLRTLDFFANTTEPLPPVVDEDVTNQSEPADGMGIASLILNSNLSFPDFTFEDLAFQRMTLDDVPFELDDNENNIFIVEAAARALRPNLDCRLYPASEISLSISPDIRLGSFRDPLLINLAAEPCRSSSVTEIEGSNVIISTLPEDEDEDASVLAPDALFGRATTRLENPSQCSDLLFTWGRLADADSDTDTTSVSEISVMGCNETVESVSTTVTFQGAAGLRIDPATPPQVSQDGILSNTVRRLPELEYNRLANFSVEGHLLDSFFSSLVTSRFAVPLDLLGDDSLETAGIVADATVRQHKMIRTQNLSARLRRNLTPVGGQFPTTTTTTTEEGEAIGSGFGRNVNPSDAQPVIDAVVTSVNSTSARRLKVDETSTRILQSLLSVILFGCLLGILLAWLDGTGLKGEGILPRNSLTIANVAALLADGNVFGFLGRGAEWMKLQDIDKELRDGGLVVGFDMGWETVRKRRRDDGGGVRRVEGQEVVVASSSAAAAPPRVFFGFRVFWGGGGEGGEEVGLGMMARVGMGQRRFIRWRKSRLL